MNITKTIILCLLSLIFLLLLSYLIGVWRTSESNDFDRPFINDGKDNDLKVSSNVNKLYIDSGTKISYKTTITPSAFYHLFGLRHANYFLPHPLSLIDNKQRGPNYLGPEYLLSAKVDQDILWSKIRTDFGFKKSCEAKLDRNFICVRMRTVLVKAPDIFGIWIRVRRGKEYITVYEKFQFTAEDLGAAHPTVYDSYITNEYGQARLLVSTKALKEMIIDPDAIQPLTGDWLQHRLMNRSVSQLILHYKVFGGEEVKKALQRRKSEMENSGIDYDAIFEIQVKELR